MSKDTAARQPEVTRQKLLGAAFAEFYRHGYQGGSLSRIVEAAGITKGALFHHFAGKQELGYAVVDELIGPLLQERWLGAVLGSADPLTDIQAAFRRYIREDVESGNYVQGCPMNNLAQEMSPLDAGFQARLDALYDAWRGGFAAALDEGARRGTVKPYLDAPAAAALIVVAQMGIWGTGKSSRDPALMERAGEALCDYLESLRA